MSKISCITRSILLVAALASAQEEITSTRLSESVLVVMGGGGNITAINTDEGIIVVDTFYNLPAAREARKLIEQLSDNPIRFVINTHYHADHTFGNQIFKEATLLAHANCAERMLTSYAERAKEFAETAGQVKSLEKQFRNTVQKDAEKAKKIKEELDRARQIKEYYEGFILTASPIGLKDDAVIKLGGKTFEIMHFGPGHTDGDLVIFIPEEKLLITGDLVFHHSIPYIDVNAWATPPGWIKTMDSLIALGEKIQHVVPGHGEIGSIQALIDQRAYLHDLWEAVGTAKQEGLTLEQAKQKIKLEQYSEYGRYNQALASNIEACWQIYEK